MRRRWTVLLCVALLPLLAACETKQPTGSTSRTVTVGIQGNATVNEVNIWEQWIESVPGSGNFDTFETLACTQTTSLRSGAVPWNYVIDVAVVRAGSTVEETVLSTLRQTNEFTSRTAYDGTVLLNLPNVNRGSSIWINGRRMTTGSKDWIEDCATPQPPPPNICADWTPTGCNQSAVPPANVGGNEPVYNVVLDPGDTIIVRVRKALSGDSPWAPFFGLAGLRGFILVDGTGVQVDGSTTSGTAEGAGFTMSYTLR